MNYDKAINWSLAVAVVGMYVVVAAIGGPTKLEETLDQYHNDQAIEAQVTAQALRDKAAHDMCGNGSFEWSTDNVLTCHVRKPLMLARAKL